MIAIEKVNVSLNTAMGSASRDAAVPLEPRETIMLSVVLPTYNESKNIRVAILELRGLLSPRLGNAYEIIVVDDDSPDKTWMIADSLRKECPELIVVRRVGERGLATAVIRGWEVARGEVLGVMDADLQHPSEVSLGLYDAINRGADLAVATRYLAGGGVSDWSVLRRVISRGAQALGLLILPSVVGRVTDPMSGYFMVRRTALAGVALRPVGYKILVEVLARGRCQWVAEVPYVFRERTEGSSKVSTRVYIDYLRHLVRLRIVTFPFARFLKFAIVGLSGVVIDMGLLYLLSDPSTLHWGLTRSKLVAAQCAIVSNFLFNDAWTFRAATQGVAGPHRKLRRFAKFEIICLAGLVLNTLILNVLFNRYGVDRYVANAVAIAAVTGWNFWLNSKLNWVSSAIERVNT